MVNEEREGSIWKGNCLKLEMDGSRRRGKGQGREGRVN